MVDKKLKKIIERHDLKASLNRKNGLDSFVRLESRKNESLYLDVQYVNDRIYCVYFLNNEFFEIEDEKLYKVVEAIVEARYSIKVSKILKKCSLKLLLDVHPERTSDDRPYRDLYSKLPLVF